MPSELPERLQEGAEALTMKGREYLARSARSGGIGTASREPTFLK